MTETRDLKGTVVVITGASSGIGQQTARTLVAAGAKVALGARRVERLFQLVAELGAENAVATKCDIRKPADCETLMQIAVETFGKIDSVIPNAGIGLYGSILDYSNERLNEMMETNFQGTIWTVRAAVPHLKKNGGDIVILCSISGFRSKKNQAVYAATKHAQVGLAIGLDDELREDGIRVTVIAPAATDTEFAMGDGRLPENLGKLGYMDPSDISFAIQTVLQQPRRLSTTEWKLIAMSQGIN